MKSLEEELEAMTFFVGEMDKERAYRIIDNERQGEVTRRTFLVIDRSISAFAGCFLLRRNAKGRLRVTMKKPSENHVLHVRVEVGGGPDDAASAGYHIGDAWASSLAQLMEDFSKEGQLYHFKEPFHRDRLRQ